MVLLALGLVLLIVTSIHLQFILSVAKFFYMIERIPPLTEAINGDVVEAYPLNEMKQIACFLLEQPEQSRRHVIAVYQDYIEIRAQNDIGNSIPSAFKLYVLLRLLFDVPEDYPRNEARFFGGWMASLPRERNSETVDMLWPLGYQNDQLIIKDSYSTYSGSVYNGLGEYDYFADRFPLRSVGDLE